jgi:hypothetical protein
MHLAGALGLAHGRVRVRLCRQRLQQQLDLRIRFP